MLDLQASVGNAAVARAITVQRDKPPAWIEDAQKELKSLFPKEKLMQGVVVKDYEGLNETLQNMGYGAWTQSKTEIYLRDPMSLQGVDEKNKRSMTRYILQHEANHIRQFATAKGPPKTWAAMLKYEIQAYTNDKKWLAANGKAEIPDAKLREMLIKATEDSLTEALAIKKEAVGKKDAEAFLYNKMKTGKLIPDDAAKDPLELYKQD